MLNRIPTQNIVIEIISLYNLKLELVVCHKKRTFYQFNLKLASDVKFVKIAAMPQGAHRVQEVRTPAARGLTVGRYPPTQSPATPQIQTSSTGDFPQLPVPL